MSESEQKSTAEAAPPAKKEVLMPEVQNLMGMVKFAMFKTEKTNRRRLNFAPTKVDAKSPKSRIGPMSVRLLGDAKPFLAGEVIDVFASPLTSTFKTKDDMTQTHGYLGLYETMIYTMARVNPENDFKIDQYFQTRMYTLIAGDLSQPAQDLCRLISAELQARHKRFVDHEKALKTPGAAVPATEAKDKKEEAAGEKKKEEVEDSAMDTSTEESGGGAKQREGAEEEEEEKRRKNAKEEAKKFFDYMPWTEEEVQLLLRRMFAYTFNLNGTWSRTTFGVTLAGGILGFVNYSCNPNAVLYPHKDVYRGTVVALVARRDIAPGEEITVAANDSMLEVQTGHAISTKALQNLPFRVCACDICTSPRKEPGVSATRLQQLDHLFEVQVGENYRPKMSQYADLFTSRTMRFAHEALTRHAAPNLCRFALYDVLLPQQQEKDKPLGEHAKNVLLRTCRLLAEHYPWPKIEAVELAPIGKGPRRRALPGKLTGVVCARTDFMVLSTAVALHVHQTELVASILPPLSKIVLPLLHYIDRGGYGHFLFQDLDTTIGNFLQRCVLTLLAGIRESSPRMNEIIEGWNKDQEQDFDEMVKELEQLALSRNAK